MIKAALFDMDGVLYDSMPNHARAWHRMATELGIDCTVDEFFAYEGRTGADTINILFNRAYGHDATPEQCKELYARKSQYFKEQPEVSVMPGAQQLVAEMQRRGIITVLVTGSGQNSLLNRLEQDYPGAFPPERRITAHNVTHGKPHPEPYLRGLELAGVKADEAIVIENAPLGVMAGRAAGIFTVAVTTGPIPRAEFEAADASLIYPSMPDCAANLPKKHGNDIQVGWRE